MGNDIGTIKTSDLGKDTLDRDKMFKDGWWLNYCFCGGRVVGDVGNPYFAEEAKNLCLHQKASCTDIKDPFLCGGMSVACCITQQGAFPPLAGSPGCVCFNKKLAGADGSGWKPALFDYKPAWGDQWWLYYIFCAGVAFHAPGGGKPLLAQHSKMLCLDRQVQLVKPISNDGNMCSRVGTMLCCWDQCEFPPAKDNPKFALCGWKLNKEVQPTAGTKPGPMSYGKPGQEEMQ